MHFPFDFPAFLGLRVCAQALGLSYSHVRKITYLQRPAPAGWPAPVKIGGKVGYLRADLERWLDSLSHPNPDVESATFELTEQPAPRRRGRPRKNESASARSQK